MSRNKIKILIVEDSKVYSAYLKEIFDRDPVLEVVGIAGDAKKALEFLAKTPPDVITLDLSLPDVQRFELLELLAKSYRTPIIVVTSMPETCEAAMAAGARDFIEKIGPASTTRSRQQFELLLTLKIKTQATARSAVHTLPKPLPSVPPRTGGTRQIIAIGASLGGTEAILKILCELPDTLPGIVIVQHMPQGFTNAYALRLQQNCKMQVSEAKQGDLVVPGRAFVAPGGRQLTLVRKGNAYQINLGSTEKVGGFCPAVDVLFQSVAAAAGAQAVGVILTGMGRDGAKGMKAMHDAGAFTMAQEKESCAVYGMPQAAYLAGGVDLLLTPDAITAHLKKTSIIKVSEEQTV